MAIRFAHVFPAFLLFSLVSPGSARSESRHFVFGLTPSASFDVRRDNILIHRNLQASAVGSLTYSAGEAGWFEVVPAGSGDTASPAVVNDLEVTATGATSATLSWSATGDDGHAGVATSYDVRYATTPITAASWSAASACMGEPSPGLAGYRETFTVTGLTAGTTFYFALVVADEVPNASGPSNVATATTPRPPDRTPPATITTLAAGTATTTTIVLSWIAPGDDGSTGQAARYDLRYAGFPITEENFVSAAPVFGEPSPAAAGQTESFTVTGLAPDSTYWFVIKTADEVPNLSELSNLTSRSTQSPPPPPPPPADTTPPAAVRTLVAETSTTTTIALSWIAPGDDGATGTAGLYDLRYSTSEITAANFANATQVSGEPAPGAAGQTESYTVTELTPGTRYWFALRTADEVPNWSGLSNVAFHSTLAPPPPADVTPPSAVMNLVAGSATETTVVLGWTAPGDDGATGTAARYDLRYSTSEITATNFTNATQVNGEPTPGAVGQTESYTVTALTPGTPYWFAIKTADEVPNWSGLSNVTIHSTLAPPPPVDFTPPAAVVNLEAGSATETSVMLRWTAPGDDDATGTAVRYDLRIASSVITAGSFVSAAPVSGLPSPAMAGQPESLLVSGLSPGTDYWFAIEAADEVPNWSPLSNVAVQATLPTPPPPPPADTTPPAAVTDLTAGSATETTIALSWTAPGDDGSSNEAAQYELRYATFAITEESFASATSVNGMPAPGAPGQIELFTVTGLAPSSTYWFAIKTADEVPNVSGLSNVPSVATSTPLPPPPPPAGADTTAPAAVTTFAAYSLTPTAVRLSWLAVGDDGMTGRASLTQIRWSLDPITGSTWASLDSLAGLPAPAEPGAAETYDWTGLTAGATYHLAVRVLDEAGNASALSASMTVTLPEEEDTSPPLSPSALSASWAGTGVALGWQASPSFDVTGYLVLRRRADRAEAQVISDTLSATTFVDQEILAGTQYFYLIVALDRAGNQSVPTAELAFVVPSEIDPPPGPGGSLAFRVDYLRADPPDRRQGRMPLAWSVSEITGSAPVAGFRVHREPAEAAWRTALVPLTPGWPDLPDSMRGAGPHHFVDTSPPAAGSCRYWIEVIAEDGTSVWMDPLTARLLSEGAELLGVGPNPTSGPLRMVYALPGSGTVRLSLHDVAGVVCGRIESPSREAGRWVWELPDLRDLASHPLPPGVYFLHLEVGAVKISRKIVLVRRN